MLKRFIFLSFLLTSLLLKNLGSEDFPIPKNYYLWINLWIKIFSKYNSNEIIFFDRRCPEAIIAIGEINNNLKELIYLNNNKDSDPFEYFMRIKRNKGYVKYVENLENLKISYDKCGYSNLNNLKISDFIFQRGVRDKIKYGIIRSGLYKDIIQSILKEHGVPTDLYLLPIIESGYWHYAHSKAGALGIWQFLKSTGKIYGLEINNYVDERIDIMKSTKAAARLLRVSWDVLGRWDLAITAYNYGLKGMINAVNKTKTKDLDIILKEYKNKRFRYASKNFYLEFLAIKIIMSDLKKYFPEIEPFLGISLERIKIERDIPINNLIKELEIDKQVFKIYNPAFKEAAFKKNIILKEGLELYLPKKENENSQRKELTYLAIAADENIVDLSKKMMKPLEQIIALNSMSEESFWKRRPNYLIVPK